MSLALMGCATNSWVTGCGNMSIDGFSHLVGRLNLCQHLAVVVQHTFKVHHLSQKAYFGHREQFGHVLGINDGAVGLYAMRARRHARWRTKEDFERCPFALFHHKDNTFLPKHIAYLMRVRNNADGAVTHSNLGIFLR